MFGLHVAWEIQSTSCCYALYINSVSIFFPSSIGTDYTGPFQFAEIFPDCILKLGRLKCGPALEIIIFPATS